MSSKDFILASSSKDRLALLEQIGFFPKAVHSPQIDEIPFKDETPEAYVGRIALEKTRAVAEKFPQKVILAADTIVKVGKKIIQKASCAEEQTAVMHLLSGKTHQVLTAVCVADGKGNFYQKLCITEVLTAHLTEEEIKKYVQSGEWEGCSGYKVEGMMAGFVEKINGSYTGLIGLPLWETRILLEKAGIKSR